MEIHKSIERKYSGRYEYLSTFDVNVSIYIIQHDWNTYRKVSNIRRTKSSKLNVSRLVLQLSLPNPMKPGVKSRMKM